MTTATDIKIHPSLSTKPDLSETYVSFMSAWYWAWPFIAMITFNIVDTYFMRLANNLELSNTVIDWTLFVFAAGTASSTLAYYETWKYTRKQFNIDKLRDKTINKPLAKLWIVAHILVLIASGAYTWIVLQVINGH